ncbi:MAG TPA: hypothetical protein VE175_02445, partial [Woeseiaceae bacterium]|nr:hypothetical protein [Woeseiaceae bacterium]
SARRALEQRPGRALAGMSTAVVAGTVLASFTKENGALLPVFVLVLEWTLLPAPQSISTFRWRAWKAVFLGFPTVLIIAYLVWRIPYPPDVVLRRDFTAWERLLTESRILWEYLFNAFIPRPGQFGPFHDGHPIARTLLDPLTFLAFASWLVAAVLAVLWRRRYPLFAFGVSWFLAGHLLESTIIPLDLYYEHRNYLAIIGPLFALCATLLRVPRSRRRKSVYAGMSAYVLVNALMLFNVTSLWGNPSVAFGYWRERFPASVYAVTAELAHIQATQGPAVTLGRLNEYVESNPKAGYLGIHALKLACILDPESNKEDVIEHLKVSLREVDFSFSAATMLSQLAERVSTSPCRGVDLQALRALAHALLENPRYASNATYNQLHHQFLALTYRYEGDPGRALDHLHRAMEYRASSDLNMMTVMTLSASEEFDRAADFIDAARARAPANPMKRHVWLHDLDELEEYVSRHRAALAAIPGSDE